MNQITEKIIELGIGTLSSVIGGIILVIIGVSVAVKNKRKSNIKISGSIVKGDIVQGDKKQGYLDDKRSSDDKRISNISLIDTEVGGDIVQGDKEI